MHDILKFRLDKGPIFSNLCPDGMIPTQQEEIQKPATRLQPFACHMGCGQFNLQKEVCLAPQWYFN